jgi:hypothetical protein
MKNNARNGSNNQDLGHKELKRYPTIKMTNTLWTTCWKDYDLGKWPPQQNNAAGATLLGNGEKRKVNL